MSDSGDSGEAATEVVPSAHPSPTPLLEPAEGLPPVITESDDLAAAADALARGSGPVAIDAERASGYRYSQRAYLLQLRRDGSGTVLIDPVALPEGAVGELLRPALAEPEWVLHAASQDLPCLAELGLHPGVLFDTELAARLAGYPRVGLGPLVEHVLGVTLEKGHSAADWSTRPLPVSWLRYAALDVELLVPLRDALEAELDRQGKLAWAREEFAAVAAAPPPAPRTDPWRRTSGLHKVRGRRSLAALRELWLARDRLAQAADVSPGRLLPDSALVAAASASPRTTASLLALPGFVGRGARRHAREWMRALDTARALPDAELPAPTLPSDGPPPPRLWNDRDPAAAARLKLARERLSALADELHLPVENLVSPDPVRRLAWSPPPAGGAEAALAGLGARQWQVAHVAPLLEQAFADAAAS
ncbi:MAG: HRDC domain-containing protein [Actinomycetales bacterium]